MLAADSGRARETRAGAPLLRRLPLLAVAAVGIWLLSSSAPKETTLVYRLGARSAGLERLEVEVQRGAGEVVRRTEFRFSDARPAPVEQPHALSLPKGDYRLRLALRYAGRDDALERPLQFEGEERIVLNLER
ncbi:MAG: hypothetical protein ACK4N5_07325 [Myxococcales bacterium]